MEEDDIHAAVASAAFDALTIRQILDHMPAAIAVLDLEDRILYCNAAAAAMFDFDRQSGVGRRLWEAVGWNPAGSETAVHLRLSRTHESWSVEGYMATGDGRRIPVSYSGRQLRDASGEVVNRLVVAVDMSERVEQKRTLGEALDHMRAVTASMADGLIAATTQGVVAYANEAAARLLGRPVGEIIGRPAAEVVPGAAGEELERGVAETTKVDDAFARADGTSVPVDWTASVLTDDPLGEGRVLVFRDATERRAREKALRREAEGLRWATRIHKALEDDRLELYAQPIVDLATGLPADRELLIRMRGVDGGIVPPASFLPAAEEHDLMLDLDAWVVEQAVALAASGRAVSFNISSQTVGSEVILERLNTAIASTGAPPRLLTVEFTETALTRDTTAAIRFAVQLHALGCRVALDDFGTGYNSFAQVKAMPVDEIKIDMQFIRDLLEHVTSESVVKAIVALADDIGADTVAEGIEDAATLARVRELGVDFGQGFHLGRPTPVIPPRPTETFDVQ